VLRRRRRERWPLPTVSRRQATSGEAGEFLFYFLFLLLCRREGEGLRERGPMGRFGIIQCTVVRRLERASFGCSRRGAVKLVFIGF
jgi:hypothetical protein